MIADDITYLTSLAQSREIVMDGNHSYQNTEIPEVPSYEIDAALFKYTAVSRKLGCHKQKSNYFKECLNL